MKSWIPARNMPVLSLTKGRDDGHSTGSG